MKALVLERLAPIEDGPLEYRSFDDPVVEPDQVLLKVSACGVCHSNLHLIEGDLKVYGMPPALPIIPGHEVVGVVAGLGQNVKDVKIGQRGRGLGHLEGLREMRVLPERRREPLSGEGGDRRTRERRVRGVPKGSARLCLSGP